MRFTPLRVTLVLCLVALLVGARGETADALSTTCTGVRVVPGANLPALVDAHPPGTTFCVASGVHRLAKPVLVKAHDAFIGEAGAVISGARLLNSFDRTSGGLWFASGQTATDTLPGTCSSNRPNCAQANDVYFDNRPLRRALSLAHLAPGSFYSSPSTGRIYLADNPTGHRVEVAVTGIAFRTWTRGGVIRGLVIEKFAGHAMNGNGWLVEDNEVRLNHGIGIAMGTGVIRRNFVHDNGQLGIGSTGTVRSHLLVEGNEVSHNNYAGYSGAWQAGGGKWTQSTHVTVKGNYFHGNGGPGIWFDWDNRNVLVDDNRIEDNAREGILIEASFDVVVRNNQVRRNGFQDKPVWTLGSGILNASSTRVEVYANQIENNFNGIGATERGGRGVGPYGVRETRDFHVHDNIVRMPTGHSGLVVTVDDKSFYESKGNRFWNNTYFVGCQSPIIWGAPSTRAGFDAFTFSQWNGFGMDTTGSLTSSCGGAAASSLPPAPKSTPPPLVSPSAPVLGNGGFESGLRGWGVVGRNESLTVVTTGSHSGGQHVRVATTGHQTEGVRILGSAFARLPVAAGGHYSISVWLRGGGKTRLRAVGYDAAGVSLGAGTVSAPMTLATAWQQLTLPITASVRAASLTVWIETAWPQAITFEVDDLTIA